MYSGPVASGEKPDSFYYKSIKIYNAGPFREAKVFEFSRDTTVVLGECGSGKTTLAQALVYFDENKPSKHHDEEISKSKNIIIESVGDSNLISQFRPLVLLSSESIYEDLHPIDSIGSLLPEAEASLSFHDDVLQIFKQLISRKGWLPGSLDEIRSFGMAIGERICLHYSAVFAARKILNVDLPLILDGAFSCLDESLFAEALKLIESTDCQKIFLVSPAENYRLSKKPDYHISYQN